MSSSEYSRSGREAAAASAMRHSASGVSRSSWSHRAVYSPRTSAMAPFVFPAMPRFFSACTTRKRGSPAAARSSASAVSFRVLPPSYSMASQFA